ncbi:DNA replication licensing factor MCM3 [Canna indica]|uniref:DNA replication licensing factor MCM3 n=1 Tax=Canna indica TaxID=4628 RepID=A0AAQ3KSL0_9LILI|nr:DNA replication licensing factor MCM3 [Canna indica]
MLCAFTKHRTLHQKEGGALLTEEDFLYLIRKAGGGTIPITARTLETIIRLSSSCQNEAETRACLQRTNVEAALQVLNFAIYHKELTDMEEREQQELEMKQKADHDAEQNNGNVDGGSRIEAFESILDQHVLANHLDQTSIAEIEQLVNREATMPYTRRQISSILEDKGAEGRG